MALCGKVTKGVRCQRTAAFRLGSPASNSLMGWSCGAHLRFQLVTMLERYDRINVQRAERAAKSPPRHRSKKDGKSSPHG